MVRWQARRGVSPFADFLIDKMEATGTRPRDLSKWLGLSNTAVSKWFNPGTIPRTPILLELAQIFGDPPETWLKVAGRPMPPGITVERYRQDAQRALPQPAPQFPAAAPIAGGGRAPMNRYARYGAGRVQQTPEEAIAEDRASIEQNPFYPADLKAAILALMDRSRQLAESGSSLGESTRVAERRAEFDVPGVSGTFTPVPTEPADEQETRTLDVGPAGRVPPQRQPLPPGRRGKPEPATARDEADERKAGR